MKAIGGAGEGAAAATVEPIKRLDTVHSQGSDSSQSESVLVTTKISPAQQSYRYIIVVVVLILCVAIVTVPILLLGGKDSSSSNSNEASSKDVPTLNAVNNNTNDATTVISSPTLLPLDAPTIRPRPVTAPAPIVAPNPSPIVTSSFQPILLNAGGFLYTDSDGNIWLSDEDVCTTGRTYNDTCPPTSVATAIDRTLYCSGRVHVEGYEIPVPSGYYALTLHFYYGGTNSTPPPVLNLYLEGQLAVTDPGNRDLFVLSVESTRVTDGFLSIQFVREDRAIRISALEVHMAVPSSVDDTNNNSTGTSTNSTTGIQQNITYTPGLLVTEMVGLLLSQGLTARILATSGQPVQYHDGTESTIVFHDKPDAGATFPDERPGNPGGWIYVSNSEGDLNTTFPGGVGAITFDADGNVLNYRSVLGGGKNGSWANCGGGKTPWGTWVSGEEKRQGRIFQVDPTGERLGEPITMGNVHTGRFESFAYDARNRDEPRFFMTKDDLNGELRRFTPTAPDWTDPWSILTGEGNIDYLVITLAGNNTGTFVWDSNFTAGSRNAAEYFPGAEGIDVFQDQLFFISKFYKTMYVLNLDDGTFVNYTTADGLFNGQPDQIIRIQDGDNTTASASDFILYFTEDGGKYAGVHGRDVEGNYYTIFESHIYFDETTGLNFSPDGKHLYIAYQKNGLLFDVQRMDGYPFNAKTLGVKYHNVDSE